MEKIVNLCKRRGFVFPSSDIYGGLGSTYDYGPLGAELKRNVKEAWWRYMVQERTDVIGLDRRFCSIQDVGSLGTSEELHRPAGRLQKCQHRFRADQIPDPTKCPDCGGELTEARQFNMMLKTFLGPVEDSASTVYLRPERRRAFR